MRGAASFVVLDVEFPLLKSYLFSGCRKVGKKAQLDDIHLDVFVCAAGSRGLDLSCFVI